MQNNASKLPWLPRSKDRSSTRRCQGFVWRRKAFSDESAKAKGTKAPESGETKSHCKGLLRAGARAEVSPRRKKASAKALEGVPEKKDRGFPEEKFHFAGEAKPGKAETRPSLDSSEDSLDSSFVDVAFAVDSDSARSVPLDSDWERLEDSLSLSLSGARARPDSPADGRNALRLPFRGKEKPLFGNQPRGAILDGFVALGKAPAGEFDARAFLSSADFESILRSERPRLLLGQHLAAVLPQLFAAGLPPAVRGRLWLLATGTERAEADLRREARDSLGAGLFLLDRLRCDPQFQRQYPKKKAFLEEVSPLYFGSEEDSSRKRRKSERTGARDFLARLGVFKLPHWELAFYKNIWQIEKDLMRTAVPQRLKDSRLAPVFLDCVRRVLLCHLARDLPLGYVQGMNVLVSNMLYSLSLHEFDRHVRVDALSDQAVDAFRQTLQRKESLLCHLFTTLLDKYRLRKCFTRAMPKIYELNAHLDAALVRERPELHKHLNVPGLGTLGYFSSSYFTCLTHVADAGAVPRLLDLLFFFGLGFQNKLLLEILLHSSEEILAQAKEDCLVHYVRWGD